MDAPIPSEAVNGSFPAQDAAGQPVATIAQAEAISAEEFALYDRQIRLWGVKAQEKIRTANILLVGIRAVANEVAKNLVLGGIGSITLADHDVVLEEDLGAQFCISEADIGKNRAEAAAPYIQQLNPRVKVHVINRDIRNEQNVDFYAAYDVIIATEPDFNVLSSLDAGARLAHRPFYAGGVHGLYGFIFADLGSHDYLIEREKSNKETQLGPESPTRSVIRTTTKKDNGKVIEMVTKRELYTPLLLANTSPLPQEIRKSPRNLRKVHPLLTCLRALWEYQRKGHGVYPSHDHADLQLFTLLATEKHKELLLPSDTLRSEFLRSFLQNLGSEFAPVTACIGGFLAQDVINVLGQREQPIQNLSLFDGDALEGPIYALHPIIPDGTNPPLVVAQPVATEILD